ncbi:patatin family protein [Photorhabdus akhurstii]|uniref:patatin-like phospholipase family protein n=1 Tax=Photorhabdus akhurstii TaxID=171438 RepID=UPI000CFA7F99|nr:patatin family protein [Photorhabdus luminescens]PQQ33977.1 patatin family protein [Photorhabdus luminescens]
MGKRIPITLGNIDLLSYKYKSHIKTGKVALVCEGGGQRGIFTAGVLDEFMRVEFNPFDLLLGTSAGAQNLSAYICGQRGYARRAISRYTTNPAFFNPLRFVRGGHLVDLDWFVQTAFQDLPLDIPTALRRLEAGCEFYTCACRADNFEPTYFQPDEHNWLEVIKASSAIPGFYRNGVTINGVVYYDGGISDAIPVEEAYRRGADTIVVIRTVPSQLYYTPDWVQRMERWLGDSGLQKMVRMLQQHAKSYYRTQKFIENPPDDVQIFEIYPPASLTTSALGSRLPALNRDYHLGRRCGRYFLETVGHLFIGNKFSLAKDNNDRLSDNILCQNEENSPLALPTDLAVLSEQIDNG